MNRRHALIGLCACVIAGVVLFAIGYRNASADPIVRHTTVALSDWPRGAAPVTVALVSDIHAGNVVTDGGRVARVAALIDHMHPDLIVLAGDFVAGEGLSDADHVSDIVPGLLRLHAPLGVIAVLGNHDHMTNSSKVVAALRQAGVTVVRNAAVRRGPLVIGGLDDQFTGFDDVHAMRVAMDAMHAGARIVVAHSPDVAPLLPPSIGMVLAGHTHCGQVVFPGMGRLVRFSDYGTRYRCGIIREGHRTTIVTAGIGTSKLPIRYGAPPDMWFVRIGPKAGTGA